MKKRIILSGLILLGYTAVNAQATIGNNIWNGSRFLGFNISNFANPLTIRTNDITRMHINGNIGTTSGFIGIGTTNPTNNPALTSIIYRFKARFSFGSFQKF